MAAQAKQEESDVFSSQVQGITQLRTEIEQREEGLRKELQQAQQLHNLHKARENEGVKKMGASQDYHANRMEMDHNANGRIKRDMYKGSDRGERIEVASLQKTQVQ